MKDNIVRIVIGVFGVMLVVLGVVGVVAVANVRRSVAASDWVNHTHAVMLEAGAILSSLYAGEANLRTYVLTTDKRDQAAYRVRFNEMVEHLEVAKALTRLEPDTQKRFLALEELLLKRIDLDRDVVQSLEQQGADIARARLLADAGSPLLAEIQTVVNRLSEMQAELLRQRDKASYLQAQATKWTVWTGLGVNVLLLLFLGWLISDDIAARRKAATALEAANAVLEQKVDERTADLVKANKELTKENLDRQWAELALAHQLRYSDLIINSISDHIFVISKAMNILRVNPAVSHTTGFEISDIVVSPMSKILSIPESVAPGTPQLKFAQALTEGREMVNREGRLICKSGESLPMRFTVVPLRDQDKVVGCVLTARLCPEEPPHAG